MKYDNIDLSDFVNILTVEKAKSNLVNKVKERRKEAGYTQQDLAKLTGISYGSIKRFEQTGNIELSSLLLIADKLDCLTDFEKLFTTPIIKDIRF